MYNICIYTCNYATQHTHTHTHTTTTTGIEDKEEKSTKTEEEEEEEDTHLVREAGATQVWEISSESEKSDDHEDSCHSSDMELSDDGEEGKLFLEVGESC